MERVVREVLEGLVVLGIWTVVWYLLINQL